MTFQDELKTLREKRGWTQVQLAKAINGTTTTVRNWEQGVCEPAPEMRRKAIETLKGTDQKVSKR